MPEDHRDTKARGLVLSDHLVLVSHGSLFGVKCWVLISSLCCFVIALIVSQLSLSFNLS